MGFPRWHGSSRPTTPGRRTASSSSTTSRRRRCRSSSRSTSRSASSRPGIVRSSWCSPAQLADAARQVAEAHARAERLESRVQSLVEELESKTGHARVVGQSPEWIDTLKKATQVAETETTVLLTGESGTGKEVVARFIHRASARKAGPFT